MGAALPAVAESRLLRAVEPLRLFADLRRRPARRVQQADALSNKYTDAEARHRNRAVWDRVR